MKKEKDKRLSLEEMGQKILEDANKKGLVENYYFQTTFKRYQTQLRLMDELDEAIKSEGPLVEKTYVKGRGNIAVNPAITEYNKVASAANGTVATLIKILVAFTSKADGSATVTPDGSLADFLNS